MDNHNIELLNQARDIISKSLSAIPQSFIDELNSLSEDYEGEHKEVIAELLEDNGYQLSHQLVNWNEEIDEWEEAFYKMQDEKISKFNEV